ncbi:MAG: SUMF1/EgtB/PvdO family nonheme iron enzyme [Anaerolineae bacterium]|nr:SUMF1/EgtB/PvdO family nonheme iron enzyme [Anaerolineae bacterium]
MTAHDPLIGLSLGQYTITGLLGKGGMASVYLGTQAAINRQVAVKVLPRSFMHDDSFMERFRRESKMIAALEHPHVLPIYDYGEQDGIPYLVMRYLEGGTLEGLIRQGPVEWRKILRITTQIGDALDYAHASGIIHRDIKPSNIMLDRAGNAFLSDFGIARLLEGTSALTGSGIVGTPAYMAPEQTEPGVPTPAMDIYAFGVTIFEAITGQLPFVADTPIAQLMMHINKPVPSLQLYNPQISTAVDEVIQRSMMKQPADRYLHAGEFASALDSAVRGSGGWEWSAETLSGATLVSIGRGGDESTLGAAHIGAASPAATPRPAPHPAPVPAVAPPRRRGGLGLLLGGLLLVGVIGVGIVTVLVSGLGRGAGNAGDEPLAQTQTVQALLGSITLSPQAVAVVTATEEPAAAVPVTPEPSATIQPTSTEQPSATPAELRMTTTLRGVNMVLIPAGPFTMGYADGYPNERPEHEITLDAFYIDETEVTNLYYKACVDAGECKEPEFVNSPSQIAYWGSDFYYDFPLIYATWQEADTYCRWRGGHLPTEAQWEKAAGYDPISQQTVRFPWGLDVLDKYYLNYGSLYGHTLEAGSYPAGKSPLGAYDMAGNLAEWVNDWYLDNYYELSPAVNPPGPDAGTFKVVRGGSYESQGNGLMTSFRDYKHPLTQAPTIGFRCAYTPSGDPTIR